MRLGCACLELVEQAQEGGEGISQGSLLWCKLQRGFGVLLLGARVGQQALTRSKLRRVSS